MKIRNQIVSLISTIVCGSPVLADEEQKPSPEKTKPPVAAREVAISPLLIGEVFKRRDRLLGKRVEIVACLLTHSEGPWICLHPDAPFKNAMSLSLPEGCVLTAKDGKQMLDWFGDNRGYSAVISGILRMRDKRSPDDPEVRLYVDVTSGRELAVDDPLWRRYIQQFKQEGEQAGAGQPATKPADKAPVKDQPSTPTSKDGPR